MTAGADRRVHVDQFLAQPKSLAAPGRWVDGNRPGEQRMRLPILVDGEISAFEVELIVNPDAPSPGLTIVLLYGRCVWRLCMDSRLHPNAADRPHDCPADVSGPHAHSWEDNRRFAKASALPRRLKNARLLPADVATNDDAFAWLLAQIKVDFPPWGSPEWPTRTGLL